MKNELFLSYIGSNTYWTHENGQGWACISTALHQSCTNRRKLRVGKDMLFPFKKFLSLYFLKFNRSLTCYSIEKRIFYNISVVIFACFRKGCVCLINLACANVIDLSLGSEF